jgi:tetratricopeptide (TPR) repeat protein
MVFDDRWAPAPEVRDRLAERALAALARLDKAVADQGHVLYLKGQALRAMERHEEAIEPLRKAAERDPDNIHIHLALGWCHKRRGRLDLAIRSLEESLSADPTQGITYYNLACYWSLAGQTHLALQHLAKAFEIDSGYRDLVADEPDFDPIRDDPGFQSLTAMIV